MLEAILEKDNQLLFPSAHPIRTGIAVCQTIAVTLIPSGARTCDALAGVVYASTFCIIGRLRRCRGGDTWASIGWRHQRGGALFLPVAPSFVARAAPRRRASQVLLRGHGAVAGVRSGRGGGSRYGRRCGRHSSQDHESCLQRSVGPRNRMAAGENRAEARQ